MPPVYQKNPDIVSRRILDEMILVPIRRTVRDADCLYTLNEVGARIWELLDGKRHVGEIRVCLVSEFAVEEAQAEADLMTLLEQLREIGAITEAGPNQGEATP